MEQIYLSLKTLTYTFQNHAHILCIKEDTVFLSKKIQSLFQSPYTAAAFPPCLLLPKRHYLHASRSRVGRTHWKPCRSVMWNLCRNSGRILLGYLKDKEIRINCQYVSFYSADNCLHFIKDLDPEIMFLFSSRLLDTSKHFKGTISFIQLVIHRVFIFTSSGNIWELTCRYL